MINELKDSGDKIFTILLQISTDMQKKYIYKKTYKSCIHATKKHT